MTDSPALPVLSGICVHWQNEAELAELLGARRNRGSTRGGRQRRLPALFAMPPGARLRARRNLASAAVNAGSAATRGRGAHPQPRCAGEAPSTLIAGFAASPTTAGLAPRLLGGRRGPVQRWAHSHLARVAASVAFSRAPALGRTVAGAAVEQPAVCALALRRSALGGDRWLRCGLSGVVRDVDLAVRLRERGGAEVLARGGFRHGLDPVPRLGYSRFPLDLRSQFAALCAASRRARSCFARSLPIGAILRLLALLLASRGGLARGGRRRGRCCGLQRQR